MQSQVLNLGSPLSLHQKASKEDSSSTKSLDSLIEQKNMFQALKNPILARGRTAPVSDFSASSYNAAVGFVVEGPCPSGLSARREASWSGLSLQWRFLNAVGLLGFEVQGAGFWVWVKVWGVEVRV